MWSTIEIASSVDLSGWYATGYLGVIGHRDYGGLLETCRYYRLVRGEVENAYDCDTASQHCPFVVICVMYPV